MISIYPIRVKFVIVNVNTVEIRSSQQNVAFRTFISVAALFENGELRLKLSFLENYELDFYSGIVIVKRKYIFEVEIPCTSQAICPLMRYFKPMEAASFV